MQHRGYVVGLIEHAFPVLGKIGRHHVSADSRSIEIESVTSQGAGIEPSVIDILCDRECAAQHRRRLRQWTGIAETFIGKLRRYLSRPPMRLALEPRLPALPRRETLDRAAGGRDFYQGCKPGSCGLRALIRATVGSIRSDNRYLDRILSHHQFIRDIPSIKGAPLALSSYIVPVHASDEIATSREQNGRVARLLGYLQLSSKDDCSFGNRGEGILTFDPDPAHARAIGFLLGILPANRLRFPIAFVQ